MNATRARSISHRLFDVSRTGVRRAGARRRGIILLMSLSLLVLFLMMLVTLVVISGQYRQSARVQARMDRTGDPPYKLTDLALKVVLRDEPTGLTVVRGHSLLEDLYGGPAEEPTPVAEMPPDGDPDDDLYTGSWRGTVTTVLTATGTETTASHISFEFQPNEAAVHPQTGLLHKTVPGEFAGRLLTFVSAINPYSENVTVRILDYYPPNYLFDGSLPRFVVARTNAEGGGGLFDTATLGDALVMGDSFLVNGRPFSGYGAGYSHVDASNEAAGHNIAHVTRYRNEFADDPDPMLQTPLPSALLPNYRVVDPEFDEIPEGRLNEDYDALDYQNMFLAYVPADATRADQIVPSFWRPELMNYWRHYQQDPSDPLTRIWYQDATNATFRDYRNDLYRALSLRPLWTDHPDFNGGNPDFGVPLDPSTNTLDLRQPLSLLTGSNDIDENGTRDEDLALSPPMPGVDYDPISNPKADHVRDVNGNGIVDQWDVDNDGDGLTDSIWIDVGLPLQRTPDGKLYKPLVAVMIRDLDGLSNVNAHMHRFYNSARLDNLAGLASGQFAGTTGSLPAPAAGGSTALRPKGRGVGPAELGLSYRFSYRDPGTGLPIDPAVTPYPRLFDHDPANDQMASLLFGDSTMFRPGRYGVSGTDQQAGFPAIDEFGSALYHADLPRGTPAYGFGAATAYGSPPDVWGAMGMALDFDGRPWMDRMIYTDPPNLASPVPPTGRVLQNYVGNATDALDEPYEIDLYSADSSSGDPAYRLTADIPYTLAELERILRWNDSDAKFMPDRLRQAGGAAFDNFVARRLVTTHSSHMPVPSSAFPSEARNTDDAKSGWLYDLYKAKLIANAPGPSGSHPSPFHSDPLPVPPPTTPVRFNPANREHVLWIDDEIKKMMPWESWRGMRFDVNRRWQNGFDDDGDGIVDEPAEAFASNPVRERTLPQITPAPSGAPGDLTHPFNDYRNDLFDHFGMDRFIGLVPPPFSGTPDARNPPIDPGRPDLARQIYARQLYCLALFVMDYDSDLAGPGVLGFDPTNAFDDPAIDSIQKADEIFKRRLAQWAINVVDCRDPDAICTPFEYDVKPFNGWQLEIDGDPTTADVPGSGVNERRIVWGMESPDLLITETLAFHNRRVKDTNREAGGAPDYRRQSGTPTSTNEGDNDLDQHRIPQGSLFVELYATGNRTSNDPQFAKELYDPGTGALDVGRLAPGGAPVWRMAISVPQYATATPGPAVDVDFSDRLNETGTPPIRSRRATTSFDSFIDTDGKEKIDLNLLSYSDPNTYTREPLELERFVWLGPNDPGATSNTFYARNIATNGVLPTGQTASTGLVLPGRYAVVGPRANTILGITDSDGDPMTADDAESPHRISLTPVQGYDNDTVPTLRPDPTTYRVDGGPVNANEKIYRATPIICGANLPAAWTMGGYTPTHGIGVNISEPLPQGTVAPDEYYPRPTETITGFSEDDAYEDDVIPDRPLDEVNGPLRTALSPNYLRTGSGREELRRVVVLQRLANPTMPFNADSNPYLTFDWQPVDLTVFNGDDRRPDDWAQPMDPDELEFFDPTDDSNEPIDGADDYDPDVATAVDMRFMSRERGARARTADQPDASNPPTGTPDTRLWSYESLSPQSTHEPALAKTEKKLKFRYEVLHTLGYLNVTMGMAPEPNLASYILPSSSSTSRNEYFGVPPGPQTFPWITWFDRPFSSPYEMTLVPHTSPSMLSSNWNIDAITTPGSFDAYMDVDAGAAKLTARGMYAHLLNFFHRSDGERAPGASPTASTAAPQLYRLFDYLETPSQFTGAQEYVSDRTAGGDWAGSGTLPIDAGDVSRAASTLSLGNNFLSRMRDPGRINLNTMPPQVWGAFSYAHQYNLGGVNGADATAIAQEAELFRMDRSGFYRNNGLSLPASPDGAASAYPTRIGHPYRDAAKADMAPTFPGTANPDRLRYEGVEATLMRSYKTTSAGARQPLFFGPQHGETYQNTNRNPYFRFEELTRMPNLTSNHSNVYAVWVTVGYFEATRQSPNAALGGSWANYSGESLPDGVWLGKEVGADDGRARRHRAFYIIDRSIPVAFERGNDHNVEKTIMVRRYLD